MPKGVYDHYKTKGKKRQPFSEEWKRNLSNARKGRVVSEETKEKLRKFAIENNLIERLRGKQNKECSAETREKISKANKGRKRSLETREKISKAKKGQKGYWEGKHLSEEHRYKLSEAHRGKNVSAETKRETSETRKDGKPYNWKGGVAKDREYQQKLQKERRHKVGFSIRYREEIRGTSHTKEYRKRSRQKRKALMRGGGELSLKTIQTVYEDNIKKYGTLTCYLCEKPIEIGKDNLEHKTPLCRGGTNFYENLEVACAKCNNRKHAKTEQEFKDMLNKKHRDTLYQQGGKKNAI